MTQGVFLYYLPGKSKESLTAAELAANPILAGPFFELIHSPRLLKTRLMGCNVHGGPDNGDGCVIAPEPQVPVNQLPGYFRETQTWRKFGDQWIGWQTDMPPGPESLRRGNQIDGYEVELGDGLIWLAPVIRAFRESSANWESRIPTVWGVDENLQPVAEPLDKFREIWNVSGKVWASVCGGVPAKMIECFEWATQCLGMNYRIGVVEASILRIFNDDTMRQVLHSALDIPVVEAAEKKIEESENPTQPLASTSI